MYLPTMLPFLIPNSPGQRHRPRIGSRVIFSLHDNGTDMNGVTEQSPSLVAGRQPRLQSLSFLPSENQDWRVDSTGPEWPQLQVVQAVVEVLEVKPRSIVVVTEMHVFETLGLPCPEVHSKGYCSTAMLLSVPTCCSRSRSP